MNKNTDRKSSAFRLNVVLRGKADSKLMISFPFEAVCLGMPGLARPGFYLSNEILKFNKQRAVVSNL